MSLYCDVSLPVPMEALYTYSLPETLWHRAQPGCRVSVGFGTRQLTGVIMAIHGGRPQTSVKPVLRLLDEVPVLDGPLIALGQWISKYYCCALGEVLRAMTPLGGEIRKGKVYSLTQSGRDAARQLHLAEGHDPAFEILRLLDLRPSTASYLKSKVETATAILKSLEKRGFIEAEDTEAERDPMRASAARLRVSFKARGVKKLPKQERELLAYLELHPGFHNVEALIATFPKASTAARALARADVVHLELEPLAGSTPTAREAYKLNFYQQAAYDAISTAVGERNFRPFLLEGITGSGKTEVYLKSIEAALAVGRGAILLVPEIGLTPAVAGQFHHRFGERIAILHSAFHDSERTQQWRRIRNGEATVVVATRSGVFAPVANLGLIIVDEEHDHSYKQQETPRYHGRDVAVMRAREAGAVVVLGSATPSLESRWNAEQGKYTRLELPERIESRALPSVKVVDMREEFLESRKQATFSRALVDAVTERLESKEQAILLMNRRGFSSFVTCRACGERVQCVNCSVTLTYHRRDKRLLCHLCNYATRIPDRCPKCDSDYLQFIGTGSERVEDELHQFFPKARIARLDRDTVGGKRDFENILSAFRERNYDLLVGTQMIAKGHDIPNVTLVGIVNADIGLALPDFRSAERTFQLLTQAAGRAGRGEIPGIVVIQTMAPDHYAVACAAQQDYEAFYRKEVDFRKMMAYPPFAALANVVVRAKDEEQALARSGELGRLLVPNPEGVRVLGPAPASVARVKNEFRYQMLIKAASRKRLSEILGDIRKFAQAEKWSPTSLIIDVDPISLL